MASKSEFESEIAKAQAAIARATEGTAAAAATPPQPRSQAARGNTPAARIARQLADKLGLSERDAVSAMTAALREKGVDAAKIPDPGGKSLTEWVEALLERVSGAVVMGAAQRIERR